MTARLEPLFHALELELLIPAAGVGTPPTRESELREWWDDIRTREKRDTAFLGESILPCFRRSHRLRDLASHHTSEPPRRSALLQVVKRVVEDICEMPACGPVRGICAECEGDVTCGGWP